jgi:hypothetical protein
LGIKARVGIVLIRAEKGYRIFIMKLKPTAFKKFLLAKGKEDLYLDMAIDFFAEVAFNDKQRLIKYLNKFKGNYVTNLLFAIWFYQYCEKVISQDDKVLKPVLLICLIDAVEEKKNISQDLVNFFINIRDEDKLYLINNFEVLKGKGERKKYQKLFDDLIKRNRIWRRFDSADYRDIDKDLKHIDRYMKIFSEHLAQIRNYVLHEARSVMSFAFKDAAFDYALAVVAFSHPKRNLKRTRTTQKHVWTRIDFIEFRRIVKRGILNKIITNRAA